MNYKLLFALSMLLAVGCTKDLVVEPYAPSDGEVFTLSIESFTDEVIGSTRAASSEISIDRGYVLFYDSATGEYEGYKSIAELTDFTQSGSTVSFTTSDYSATDKIIAIFNHDVDAKLPSSFSDVTSANLSEYFPISNDYLAQVQAEMNSGNYALGMPMYLNDFTDSDRTIREVYRSVARMELFIKDDLTIEHESHTHSIGSGNLKFMIVNDISASSVGVGTELSYTKEDCYAYGSFEESGADAFPYSLTSYGGNSEISSATDTSNKVYLHAFPYATTSINGETFDSDAYSDDRFAIILRHGDTNVYTSDAEVLYYKLNLLDKASSTYFDVEANHSYRVVITAVNSRGYTSLEEAYLMPPSNIEYEIYDDKGGLTYSNGQYAISMDEVISYDEIYIYGANATTIEFNNLCYVLPDGGEMNETEFLKNVTNEVYFKVGSSDSGLDVDYKSDFGFSETTTTSELTDEGKSISLTLTGEGTCTISLKITLGNLDVGRDEITITKVATNGDGDGAFDAHPNQVTFENMPYVASSWQSADLDFGARSDGTSTVVYMGHNATPTGYRTMDGYVSSQTALNSYPVFSDKTRTGYFSYLNDEDEVKMVMVQMEQLSPIYVGHFGRLATDGGAHHFNPVICERIEELPTYSEWGNAGSVTSQVRGVINWSEATGVYYPESLIYYDSRYQNFVDGYAISNYIQSNFSTSDGAKPTAVSYCYMKNDIDGDGIVNYDGQVSGGIEEPIEWYLPAQNQMMAMWISRHLFDSDVDAYNFDDDSSNPYYWTCSEYDSSSIWSSTEIPDDFTTYVLATNLLEGEASSSLQKGSGGSNMAHVRCVRAVNY
ncbi:MAG: hypothetical protein SNG49_01460 [Rikenellaceae bacterium]